MRDIARWALIVWPKDLDTRRLARTVVSCVPRGEIESAVRRGAMVVGVEREEWCYPRAGGGGERQGARARRRPRKDDGIGEQERD